MFQLGNSEFFICLSSHVLECSSYHVYFSVECINKNIGLEYF